MKRTRILVSILVFVLAFSVVTASAMAASVGYKAGFETPVRHQFYTSTYQKPSGSWQSVYDNNTHSYRVDMADGEFWESFQYTWVYSSGGTVLSDRTDVASTNNTQIPLNSNANSYSTVKLRIKNPSYDSDTSLRLKTEGSMVASYN